MPPDEGGKEPTAAITEKPKGNIEDDWDWDLLGACPAGESVEALVIDDYLLIEDHSPSNVKCHEETGAPNSPVSESSSLTGDPPYGLPAVTVGEAQPGTWLGADGAAGPTAAEQVAPVEDKNAEAPTDGTISAALAKASMDPCGYVCATCVSAIFKEEDILSSNYHAMTGPGYLTGTATNVSISLELQTQLYTTGKYTVREVSCGGCAAILGITYVGAVDARNRYKVGKFLLGRDRLRLPPGVVHPMEAA